MHRLRPPDNTMIGAAVQNLRTAACAAPLAREGPALAPRSGAGAAP